MASSSGCAPEEVARSLPDVEEKDGRASGSESTGTDRCFPRSCRLTARRQFLDVYNRGQRVARPSFLLFGLLNDVGHCRLGLTASRKVGNAVARNRVKRVMRDIFRRHRQDLGVAMDLVVNPHSSMLSRSAQRIEQEFLQSVAELVRRVRR
jgi:ribonuclease P protein component